MIRLKKMALVVTSMALLFATVAHADFDQDVTNIANLASYGGGYNVAMLANNTTVDAIESRQGIGNNKVNPFVASGTNGVALWLTPTYLSVDSDSYKNTIEGETFKIGTDTKLASLALGLDFGLSNSFRLGAMANLGAGEAKGKGYSEVKNEFDYYSLALYGGYNIDNFSLNADFTYTKVSNELTVNVTTPFFKDIKEKVDTKVFSYGLTGQYVFNTQLMDIAPHVGVRYTSFDLGDYDSKVMGTPFIKTKYKKANLVSVPFGLTLSKEFTDSLGKRKARPFFDVTITSNMGDTKEKYQISMVAAHGTRPVDFSSEYVDSVTYKASAGVDVVLNGHTSLDFELSYLGSKNQSGYQFNAMYKLQF